MKSIQDIIDLLDDVPEDAVAYEYIGSKKEEIEYGYLCARAKVTIQQLLSHSKKLQKDNQKLRDGTKLILDGIKNFERTLGL